MDGDNWSAKLFTDPSHPATDVRFYNSETKQTYEVNYKLTDDTEYIEHHLEKYPDLHEKVWKTCQLGSQVKQNVDMEKAKQFKASLEEIGEIFWETKK